MKNLDIAIQRLVVANFSATALILLSGVTMAHATPLTETYFVGVSSPSFENFHACLRFRADNKLFVSLASSPPNPPVETPFPGSPAIWRHKGPDNPQTNSFIVVSRPGFAPSVAIEGGFFGGSSGYDGIIANSINSNGDVAFVLGGIDTDNRCPEVAP